MGKKESNIRINDQSPLKWAEGWNRVPIGERKEMKAWKKPFAYYREALVALLVRLGANEVVISFNMGDEARRDPGVTSLLGAHYDTIQRSVAKLISAGAVKREGTMCRLSQ